MGAQVDSAYINRRQFLQKGGAFATAALVTIGSSGRADEQSPGQQPVVTHYKGETPPIKVGLIGCGNWGREILRTLTSIPFTPVVAICDIYPAYLRRAERMAPGAKSYSDYRDLLADANVEAVVVATPTHQHKQIVLDALKAGKHVYCEAPLASTIEDAKEIAAAARDAITLNFQPGLQFRADKQIVNLELHMIRSGVLGKNLKCYAQYHEKNSWRRSSGNPDQERALNWRLDNQVSLGLIGEVGIHQIDIANWFYRSRPIAVRAFGSLVCWNDGRDVPDNVVALFEYPEGVFLNYEATLGNSFNKVQQIFYGTNCAILMKDRRAWMFKEADAPLLGFEVYAMTHTFFDQTGLVLGAGSTTQEARERLADINAPADPISPLQYSLQNFAVNSYNLSAAVKDFNENFPGADKESLLEYLKALEEKREPAANYRHGLEATVVVIRAKEALETGKQIELQEDDFRI